MHLKVFYVVEYREFRLELRRYRRSGCGDIWLSQGHCFEARIDIPSTTGFVV
jgi:hypothetical protein